MRGLEFVKKVKAKGRTYYYFNTGKMLNGKLVYAKLPDIKSPQFGATYATMRGHRNRTPDEADADLTYLGLVDLYEKSPKFRGLAASSQSNYRTYLMRVDALLPNAPANEISRGDVIRMMDSMADKPSAANMVVRALGSLYKWGRDRGHVTADPTRDVPLFDEGEHQPWPEWLVEKALEADDQRVRLSVAMLYYTAQRIGDVCAMRWSDIRDGALTIAQQKTGKAMHIPIHDDLRRVLDETPRTGLTIIAHENGRTLNRQTVRKWLQAFAADFGADVVAHGLRKNAVNALLGAGCSIAETSAISGQSLQMVEHYAKARDTRKLSSAAILKWQKKSAK